jgi:hypothetical protein
MGTKLVGTVDLENGERVFVVSAVRTMEAPLRERRACPLGAHPRR